MTRTRITPSAALLLCLFGLADKATAQTVTDERVWFNLILQDRGEATTRWHWTMETILRSRDGVEKLDQAALRPTVFYNVTAHSSVGGGYLFGRQDPAEGANLIEHRFYGQYMWRGRVSIDSEPRVNL